MLDVKPSYPSRSAVRTQTEVKAAEMGPNLLATRHQSITTGVHGNYDDYISPNVELRTTSISGKLSSGYGNAESLTLDMYQVGGEKTIRLNLKTDGARLGGFGMDISNLDASMLPPSKALSAETDLSHDTSFLTSDGIMLKGKSKLSYEDGKLVYESTHERTGDGFFGTHTLSTTRLEIEASPDLTRLGKGTLTVDRQSRGIFSKELRDPSREIDIAFDGLEGNVTGYVTGWSRRA